jgi:hypothetical protein
LVLALPAELDPFRGAPVPALQKRCRHTKINGTDMPMSRGCFAIFLR